MHRGYKKPLISGKGATTPNLKLFFQRRGKTICYFAMKSIDSQYLNYRSCMLPCLDAEVVSKEDALCERLIIVVSPHMTR